ncbi:bacitracin ABC transporter ATP-binding protein [Neobacillus sp. LXY-4]
MYKENKPLLSDEFLDNLANEINQQNGESENDQSIQKD